MFGQIKLTALLIVLGITAVTSFGSGVWVRDAFCDSAAAKVQLSIANGKIEELNRNITARDEAASANSVQAEKDRAELERLQGAIDEAKISAGVCFTSDDVDGLRNNLWGK